jgi:hypothetical protein
LSDHNNNELLIIFDNSSGRRYAFPGVQKPWTLIRNALTKNMLLEKAKRKHIFYHADRSASLKEEQEIKLGKNGLSYFGNTYWPIFQAKSVEEMNPAQQREFYLEQIRNEPRYFLFTSRLQSIFAANTISEAIIFCNSILPKPNHTVPIIEIFADRFWTLDSNWLDYENKSPRFEYYRNYWEGKITNHCPEVGERRPPRLEVLIPLPAMTGKIVDIVE